MASTLRVDREQGATFVELFFDLVFVYAITQLTSMVLHDLTWSGVGHAAVLFWLVWWSWTQFTWTLNMADTEHVWVRVPTLVATAIAFFLAQAVPDALGSAGLWFAGAYALGRLLGLAVQFFVVRGGDVPDRDLLMFTVPSLVGIVLVLVGGFAEPDARLWFWVAAFVSDLVTVAFAGRGTWELSPGHFAERHGLIVEAGAWARDVFSLGHALIVGGVIGIAVGFEQAIAHPDHALEGPAALALTGGVVLFVGGMTAASARAGLRAAIGPRVAMMAVVLSSTPVIPEVQAGVTLWALALLSVALAAWETRHLAQFERSAAA